MPMNPKWRPKAGKKQTDPGCWCHHRLSLHTEVIGRDGKLWHKCTIRWCICVTAQFRGRGIPLPEVEEIVSHGTI